MITLTVYLKPHHRRPIRFGNGFPLMDPQADLPLAWCVRCGREVFDAGQDRCTHCRQPKGDKEYAA